MVKLEQVGESQPTIETKIPQEILEMEKNLVGKARNIFDDNHELVKEAMFGMESRKAKEVMKELAECRERTKEVLKEFRETKEKIYPIS